jgi:hypothetical protein
VYTWSRKQLLPGIAGINGNQLLECTDNTLQNEWNNSLKNKGKATLAMILQARHAVVGTTAAREGYLSPRVKSIKSLRLSIRMIRREKMATLLRN